jgi:hypothetical protein
MEHSPSWEASSSQEIPHIMWNQWFVTMLTTAHPLSLAWARSIHSMPPSYFLKLHFHVIPTCAPGFSVLSLAFRFPYQNSVCILLFTYATCPPPPPESDSIITKHTCRWTDLLSHVTCSKILWKKLLLPCSWRQQVCSKCCTVFCT